MTKEELIQRLKELQRDNGDPEGEHLVADDLLLEFIDDADITGEYVKIKKWYA